MTTLYCKRFYQQQFESLEKYLSDEYGWSVVSLTDETDRADFQDRIIYINSRCHPETRFYTLLHEYGHVNILERDSSELRMTVPCYQAFHADRSTRSKSGKIATIVEEIEAWKRGRLLALEMNWHINIEKYEKNMNEALWGYIEWAGNRQEYL